MTLKGAHTLRDHRLHERCRCLLTRIVSGRNDADHIFEFVKAEIKAALETDSRKVKFKDDPPAAYKD